MRDDALTTREPVSDSKHTPGPWKAGVGVDGEADRWGVWAAYGNRQWHIATVENGAPGDTLETEAATAHLIAAAPDLLAACEALLEASRNLRGEFVCTGDITARTLEPMFEADDEAQAALAKAKGASQ